MEKLKVNKRLKAALLTIVLVILLPAITFQVLLPTLGIGRVYKLTGNSMQPLLVRGHSAYVSEIFTEYTVGEIAAHFVNFNKSIRLNRIKAVAGDTIHRDSENLYINDLKVCKLSRTDILDNGNWLSSLEGTYTMQEDEFFILGDYTDDSLDSRYFGPVKRKDMLGVYKFEMGIFGNLLFF
ncbi:MAG: signal peptidase I [Lentisphaeraceae bacterium]|nr:signal peptidase I [Lentisphaeraceae bacterium]